MNESAFLHEIEQVIENADACVSLLVYDFTSERTVISHLPQKRVVSASTIKTPIMMTAFHLVQMGKLSLEQPISIPADKILYDTKVFEFGAAEYSLQELVTWMMINSDNTATNVLIDLLGMDEVNKYCASLGLKQTLLQRKMLDWKAIEAGRNNYTSASEQLKLFAELYHKTVLTPGLCELALSILKRQRDYSKALRYLCTDDAVFAHKTGELDFLGHDAGIFYLPKRDYYFGCFVTDAKDDTQENPVAARTIGRISKIVYNYLRE
ncbi:MAG: Beta-lactamase2 domain-containing protein [Oscillospiraceae bacterium]|jgi:beta-lactamase class A